jgi:hypothetical protein
MEQRKECHSVREKLKDRVQFIAEGGVVAVEDDLQDLYDHDEWLHGHLEGLGGEMVVGLSARPLDDAPGGGVVRRGGDNFPGGQRQGIGGLHPAAGAQEGQEGRVGYQLGQHSRDSVSLKGAGMEPRLCLVDRCALLVRKLE